MSLAPAPRTDGSRRSRALVAITAALCLLIGLVATAVPAAAAGGQFTISAPQTSLNEGSGGGITNFPFVVSYQGAALGPTTVLVQLVAGAQAEAEDFDPSGGFPITVDFGGQTCAPAACTQDINVPVVADAFPEGNETFTLQLTDPSAGDTIGTGSVTFTIVDDDGALPVARIGDASVTEGTSADEAARTTIQFTVTVDPPSQEQVEFSYETADGVGSTGAVGGTDDSADYITASGTVVFDPGQASETIVFSAPRGVIPDAISEPDETFRVMLSRTTTNVNLVDGNGLGTILDDDGAATVSIDDPTVAEDVGTDNNIPGDEVMTFTVTLDKQSGRDIRVNYATADGTATRGADYASRTGSVVFAAGSPAGTTQTIEVPIVDDNLNEGDETFTVTLSAVTNAAIGKGTGTGTIEDDDVTSVSVDDVSIDEGDTGDDPTMQFTLTIDPPSSSDFTVQVDTVDGTAEAGKDYTAVSQLVTFPAGEVTQGVDVPILSDIVDEQDETFTLELTDPTSGPDRTATGTITDDDAAPSITIEDAELTEGDTGTADMTFTARLSSTTERVIEFEVDAKDDSAESPSDYQAIQDLPVRFDPLDETATFTIPIVGDLIVENDETFEVDIDAASLRVDGGPAATTGVTIADGNAVGTILDNENKPSISISDESGVEGDPPAPGTAIAHTVSMDQLSTGPVTVDYTVIEIDAREGNALTGGDYTVSGGASGEVTFSPGSQSEAITINTSPDRIPENEETYRIMLSNPSGANIADGEAIGTINDDDSGQGTVPTISIDDVTVTEGTGGVTPVNATFTITASSTTTGAITVDYATVDGTAVAGKDYTSTTGRATIQAGQTSTTVTVPITRDTVDEANETFTVVLSNAGNASIADGDGLGTINDDDPPPTISIGDVTVAEGNAGTTVATFPITLSNPADRDITVDVATRDGVALAGIDYTQRSATVTIDAETTSATFDVTVVGDVIDEPDERFFVDLTNPSYGTLGDAAGGATITDDDDPPEMTIGDASEQEGDGPDGRLEFLVSLSQPSSFDVTVDYASADGPDPAAEAPGDYDAVDNTLTIPAGDRVANIPVSINGDSVEEEDENLTVTLSNAVNAEVTDGTAIGTIVDDDDVLPDLTIDDIAVIEGDSGTKNTTFTVTLDSVSPNAVEVDYATEAASATAGSDFTARSGSLTFAPGDTEKTVTVTVRGDQTQEANETFRVRLSNPVNAEIVDGLGVATITDDDALGTFVAVDPARILDTRQNGASAAVGQGQTLVVQVAGQGGVPANGVDAVVLNVTVVNGTQDSYLSVTPDGSRTTSSLNFSARQVVANHVTVPLDEQGRIKIFNKNGSVDVIVDVFGWYHDGTRTTPGSHYRPVTPTRLADTRSGLGGRSTRLGQTQTMLLDVTTAPVPLGNVSAVVVNVTITNASQGSYLSVTPDGARTTSSINFAAGDTRANLVTVPVDGSGNIKIFNKNGTVDVIVDVFGYYSTPGKRAGVTFRSVTPTRLVDTRDGTGGRLGALSGRQEVTYQVTGGVVPANATAVVSNATAVRGTTGGFLALTPSGFDGTSNVNFAARDIVPNQAIVPFDSQGRLRIFNRNGDTHALLDVSGYFV